MQRRGFSLIELSIVLVILGLLTGGILAGQSLVHAAQLRRHLSESATLSASIMAFRDKYFYPPGDMNNAVAFWADTVNGDGNGKIDTGPEIMQSWRQLVRAGLMKGEYDGQWAPGPYINSRVPPSPLGSTMGWWLQYAAGGPVSGYYNHIGPGTMLLTESFPNPNASYYGDYNNTLLPEDVWNIDKKIDDGNGLNGTVETWNIYFCVNADGSYALDGTNKYCWFWQRMD